MLCLMETSALSEFIHFHFFNYDPCPKDTLVSVSSRIIFPDDGLDHPFTHRLSTLLSQRHSSASEQNALLFSPNLILLLQPICTAVQSVTNGGTLGSSVTPSSLSFRLQSVTKSCCHRLPRLSHVQPPLTIPSANNLLQTRITCLEFSRGSLMYSRLSPLQNQLTAIPV